MSELYAILFTVAFIVLIAGLGRKIVQYHKIPAPLKIPVTPAPITKSGVYFRLAKEVILFSSLFRSNKWTWLFGWMFHMSLFIIIVYHLRYFMSEVPAWIVWLQSVGKYAAFTMLIGLAGLMVRRIAVPRIRHISAPSDYLWLVLLFIIGLSGVMMRFVTHTDIVQLKAWAMGLTVFDWQPLPMDGPLLIHLASVAILMILLPFSKLLHIPGVFFAPTRNQVDNPREARHVSAWALELDAEKNKAQP